MSGLGAQLMFDSQTEHDTSAICACRRPSEGAWSREDCLSGKDTESGDGTHAAGLLQTMTPHPLFCQCYPHRHVIMYILTCRHCGLLRLRGCATLPWYSEATPATG